jgi:cephalosporin hydroxylase
LSSKGGRLKSKKITQEEIEQFILDAGSDSLSVFGGTHEGGIHIQQVPDELAPCIAAILKSDEQITSYLEIGVAAGGTTFIFNHFFQPEKTVLIDDNRHPKHVLRPEILKEIERLEIIGNSRDPEIVEQITGSFDLIVIDGDHSYEGVKADIDNYLPMLRKGGFLVLHDTVFEGPDWGVSQMVAELKNGFTLLIIGEYRSTKYPVCGLALFRKVSE